MRNELGSWREVGGGRCTRRAALRGRRLRIAWQEDEGTLWQRYRGEPDPELRTRWHALGLLRQGRSATAAAALVGVHRGSVQRWLAWYRQGGLAAVAQHRQGGRQGRAAYLTAAQHAQLKAETAQGTLRTAGEAVRWAEQRFGVRYSAWGRRALLKRLAIGKQVPRPLAAQADLEAQEAWKSNGLGCQGVRRAAPAPTSGRAGAAGR